MIRWFFVLFIPSLVFAGDGVRGGGDIAQCEPSSENNFVGAYPLGYLQRAVSTSYEKSELLTSTKKCDQVLDQIKIKLTRETPLLAEGFKDFLKSFNERDSKVFSGEHESLKRKWISCKTEKCLNNFKDEGIEGHLVFTMPKNCSVTSQFALRKEKIKNKVKYITYYLNESALNQLKGPMCAFNLVHEWLRDFESESDSLYSASFEVFSDNLKQKITKKEGLYQFLPKVLLKTSSVKSSLDQYVSHLIPTQKNCLNRFGSKICSLEFVQIGLLFGVVVKKDNSQLVVSIPEKQSGKLRSLKISKSEAFILDWSEVDPGFLTYLRTNNPFNQMNRNHGTSIKNRKPAEN